MALRTVLTLIGAGGITSNELGTNSVTAAAIATGAVGSDEAAGLVAGDLDLTGTYNFTGTLQSGGASVAVGSGNLYYAVAVAAVTSNITNFAAMADTIDGISLSQNQDILVIGQTSQAENGIYNVDTVGTGSNGSWTRAAERDLAAELPTGMLVYVARGTVNAEKLFKLTSMVGTVGSDAAVFEEHQEGMTPLGGGEPVAVATGDASTLNFDLPSAGVVYASVFVSGILQDPSVWTIGAGAGTAGVDRLEFSSGNAPATSAPIEAILFIRS